MAGHKTPKAWDCTVAYNDIGGYFVPVSSSSRHCSQHILNGRVFEPRMPEFVARHAGRGDVVHAGTFFGDFLPAFSRAMAPGARVWAYEPVEENFACAKATLELNRADNVVLTMAGLGEAASEGVVVTTDAEGVALGEVAYVSTSATAPTSGSETIRIVSIDDTVPADRQVSIIQLDVEGFEQQALQGALRTIARCKPILILETLPPPAWVAQHLSPLGYRERGGVHANVVLSVKPTGGLGELLRWQARSFLKAVLPAGVRSRLRRAQATEKATRLPTAASSGALPCAVARQADGSLVCAPPGAELQPCAGQGVAAGASTVRYGSVGYGQDLVQLAAGTERVQVVEPDPDKLRYARMTAIINRLDNVQIEASAAAFESRQA